MDRRLDVTDEKDAKTDSDVKTVGNTDGWVLLTKASSVNQGFSKSSKANQIDGVGCWVQVSTLQKSKDGAYAVAEATSFIPGVKIVGDINGGAKLVAI